MVPHCLPDCRPPIENFAALSLVIERQSPLVIVVAMLDVFAKIYKSSANNKQAHIAIQRYQQDHRHFSKLLDANFNGVMSFDCDGIVTAFNLACERYFDVAPVMAIGTPANQFVAAEVLEPLLERARSFPKDKKIGDSATTTVHDSVGFRTDGSDFPIQIAAFYSRVEQHVCITLVIDDISDRYESARESEQAFVEMKTLRLVVSVR